MKDDKIKKRILESAKEEFSQKGYIDASMRNIAKKAGVTTGSMYNRFADKQDIFRSIVSYAAESLYDYYVMVHQEFAKLSPQQQLDQMNTFSGDKIYDMINIIYDNFEAFDLIINKGKGSEYEDYIDKMVKVETDSTYNFLEDLKSIGVKVNELRQDMNHMLSSAFFNGIFEIVAHKMPKDKAINYIETLTEFYGAGWDRILNIRK